MEKKVPLHWLELRDSYGSRVIGQCRNREWRRIYSRHGDKLGLSYDEVVSWGKWLVASSGSDLSEDAPPEAGLNKYISDRKVWYDEDRDTYVANLPGVPQLIELPGSIHRDIVRAYSNFDNAPASVNQLAREFGLPRNWLIKYLRAHEITHDREPFTPEEIMSRTDDDLAEEALQIRRASIYTRIEQDKWKDIKKDANKWRIFETEVLRDLMSAVAGREPAGIPSPPLPELHGDFAAVVGLSDLHWGKYSDKTENWEQYGREICRDRLFDCTQDAVARLLKLGTPEKFYVPIGSDFLHIDNDLGNTTRGTPQDMDGTPAEILISACELMEDWVGYLRSVAPVELVLMSGNHDRTLGLALLLYLDAFFRDDDGVTVQRDARPRAYRRYGSNLIGFVHGDGVHKTRDLAGHMAREAAEEWPMCEHKTVYTGHLHSERVEVDTVYGVTRRQLPSLSGPDRWHARKGYIGTPKSLPIYVHDKDRGLICVVYANKRG